MIRYTSDDTATPVEALRGRPSAILPDGSAPERRGRPTAFWIVSGDDRITWLTHYDPESGATDATSLPPGATLVDAPAAPLGWALDFPGEQATLALTRSGRIVPLCSAAIQGSLPDRLP